MTTKEPTLQERIKQHRNDMREAHTWVNAYLDNLLSRSSYEDSQSLRNLKKYNTIALQTSEALHNSVCGKDDDNS